MDDGRSDAQRTIDIMAREITKAREYRLRNARGHFGEAIAEIVQRGTKA